MLCLFALVCRVSAVMGGKGGGRKGRYQGRATKLEKREAETILREFLCCQIGRKLTDLTCNLCCNCLIPRPHSIALQMMEWDLGMRLCIDLSYVNILKHAIADCYILYCTVEVDFFWRSLN